jgi:hypothetical protein
MDFTMYQQEAMSLPRIINVFSARGVKPCLASPQFLFLNIEKYFTTARNRQLKFLRGSPNGE